MGPVTIAMGIGLSFIAIRRRPPTPEGVAVMGENLTASELGEKATGSGEGHR
jgi:hypothetical protein